MNVLLLPESTRVEKVIHKNMFDPYCNTKEKKLFSEYILKMIWLHKLSKDTIHLEGKTIQEIQTIQIELKKKDRIDKILNIIDKTMPYTLIFLVHYHHEFYISTSVKHLNEKNENSSIIDWTFHTDWMSTTEKTYPISLHSNLDLVYHNFCNQLNGIDSWKKYSLEEMVNLSREVFTLEREISILKKKIGACKQFNQKVELNLELREKTAMIEKLKQAG